MMLWTGVSLAHTPDGRASLLSLGMSQFGLADLLLTAPAREGNDALAYFFDLLTYVAERGEVIAAGETVGRTEDEKLVVKHEPSPIDRAKNVWRVDL